MQHNSSRRIARRFREQLEKATQLSQIDPGLAKAISVSGLDDFDNDDDKVKVKQVSVKSTDLGPSQSTMRIDDVLGNALDMLLSHDQGPLTLGAITSSDNRIMDGHHRWAGSIIAFGKDAKVKVWKANIPGENLVKVLNLVTKGILGRNTGNSGSASINDLNPAKVKKHLEGYAAKGRKNKYLQFTPGEFKELMEYRFGSLEAGIEILSKRAALINKSIPSWAPDRSDMPVIQTKEIPGVAGILGDGMVDWKEPFSDEVKTGSPSIKNGTGKDVPMTSNSKKIAAAYAESKGMLRVAGEVRFIKDRSGDKGEWAFSPPGASERDISGEFEFRPSAAKPLATALRSSLMALGHAQSAATTFTKIKSRNVSPDGNLGGKGYIQKITDIRRSFMNCVEALSSISDTLYDEISAPHWQPGPDMGNREREEVEEIMEEAEEIREDPESWAEEQEDDPTGKTARLNNTKLRNKYNVSKNLVENIERYVSMIRHSLQNVENFAEILEMEGEFGDEAMLGIAFEDADKGINVLSRLLDRVQNSYSKYNKAMDLSAPNRVASRYIKEKSNV